jgi:hypothetical protein
MTVRHDTTAINTRTLTPVPLPMGEGFKSPNYHGRGSISIASPYEKKR